MDLPKVYLPNIVALFPYLNSTFDSVISLSSYKSDLSLAKREFTTPLHLVISV